MNFEVNQTKMKGGCQSGRKVVPHDSKSDLPLDDVQVVPYLLFSRKVMSDRQIVLGTVVVSINFTII